MEVYKTVSFLIFVVCIVISLQIRTAHDSSPQPSFPSDSAHSSFFTIDRNSSTGSRLKIDYYRDSCPNAEKIVRSTVAELYESKPEIAPAIIRLFFHDCFPQGCDASVMLDPTDGLETEQKAGPNRSLKHLEAIDTIKSKLEAACPGVVSCADIIVLAARESVVQAGGPFYPLYTGRRDGTKPSIEKANELPTPDDSHPEAIHSFASRGFDARETVALLGAHSVGRIHCEFLEHRLHDGGGNGKPDPAIDTTFLETMKSTCNTTHSRSDSPSLSNLPSSSASRSLLEASSKEDPAMRMDYEGPRKGFGTLYYKSLLQRRGILFVDQQLTSSEDTETWVRAYASDVSLFQRDFGLAMTKLSNLQVLTAPKGQVRTNCRKLN